MTLEDQVRTALEGTRFAGSTLKSGEHWTGEPYVLVEWSWLDDERAALVAHLKAAGIYGARVIDRVANVMVVR